MIGNIPAGLNGLFKLDHSFAAITPNKLVNIHTLHRKLGHMTMCPKTLKNTKKKILVFWKGEYSSHFSCSWTWRLRVTYLLPQIAKPITQLAPQFPIPNMAPIPAMLHYVSTRWNMAILSFSSVCLTSICKTPSVCDPPRNQDVLLCSRRRCRHCLSYLKSFSFFSVGQHPSSSRCHIAAEWRSVSLYP